MRSQGPTHIALKPFSSDCVPCRSRFFAGANPDGDYNKPFQSLSVTTTRLHRIDAMIHASRHDDTNHTTLLRKGDCLLIDPSASPTLIPHRTTDELTPRPDCAIMALRLDSLSITHSTVHITPLLLNNLRPLTCLSHDTTMVSVPIDDYTFPLTSLCDAFERMGHTTLLQASCKSGRTIINLDSCMVAQAKRRSK